MITKWLQRFRPRTRAVTEPVASVNWREEVRRERLSREEFCRLCVIAMQELCPDTVLEPVELPDQYRVTRARCEPLTISFENIWRQSRLDPGIRLVQIERFARMITMSESSPAAMPEKASIVPLIKDETYLNFGRNKQTGELPFANEHLAGDLWIVYAIDTPDAMKTLSKDELQLMNLEPSDLKSLALKNLRRILPPVERHGGNPYYMLTAGSDYVASLILFEDLWDDLKDTVEGDVVAGIPSRDVLLFTGTKSAEGIAAMRRSIDDITASGGYLVSRTMFRLHPDGWKVFS